MKIKLAKTAGFCMGVRRAMQIALFEANKGGGKLFTYGPLIHNGQVLELLRSKGVQVKETIEKYDKGRIIIRAHGITPVERSIIRSSQLQIIDATCPRVAKVHSIIKQYARKGFIPVIFGDQSHPEVIGLMGYSQGRGIVISSTEEVGMLPEDKEIVLVSQTTQDIDAYREVMDAIQLRCQEVIVFDTICDETYKRQKEIRVLASEVDTMVIVGGYRSGNTKRLYQISKSTGKPTFHIEDEYELSGSWFSSAGTVGVSAGASTPNWMIKRVIERLMTMGLRRHHPLSSFARKAFRFLFKTNILVASGAFALTYAGLLLSKDNPDLVHPLIASFYVYSMHILNRSLDKGASAYNDPDISQFYSRHRIALVTTSLIGIFAGVLLCYSLGQTQFFLFIALTALGLFYSIPIIPARFRHTWGYAKMKDLPGSKTMAEALAWGIIGSLLPFIGKPNVFWLGFCVSFLFISSMCYSRAGLLDILNIQGDLIVGRETLAVSLGAERALRVLLVMNGMFGVFILGSTVLGIVSNLGYLLFICFLISFGYLFLYRKEWIQQELFLQRVAEGNLLLAGLFALVWYRF